MTDREFELWYKHFRALNPGVDAWLAKKPQQARNDSDLTQADVLRAWRLVLRDCELDDAKRGTEAIAKGDVESPPGFDSFPRTIRKLARGYQASREGRDLERRRQPRYIDGQEVFRCVICRDTGLVSVVHPVSVAKLRRGEKYFTSIAIACNCDFSAPYHEHCPQFDPELHILVSRGADGDFKSSDAAWREVEQWVESGRDYWKRRVDVFEADGLSIQVYS